MGTELNRLSGKAKGIGIGCVPNLGDLACGLSGEPCSDELLREPSCGNKAGLLVADELAVVAEAGVTVRGTLVMMCCRKGRRTGDALGCCCVLYTDARPLRTGLG